MKEFKIPQKLTGWVRATLEHVKYGVEVQNNLSEASGTSIDLRQGNALSCILFNIALEKVVRDSGIETKGTTYNKTILILAYADNIVFVWGTTGVLKEAIIKLSKAVKEMGFTINLQRS
jgi:sorting nexin-29